MIYTAPNKKTEGKNTLGRCPLPKNIHLKNLEDALHRGIYSDESREDLGEVITEYVSILWYKHE